MEEYEAARIETARLSLRPFAHNDQDILFTLYGNPRVMGIRKIGTQTREKSDQRLEIMVDQWRRKGFGYWAIFETQSGEFIGDCGLRADAPNPLYSDTEGVALSYGLIPDYWGRGFTTEAARAILNYGFPENGFDEVYAMSQKENMASMRILEKLGFEYCFEFIMKGQGISRTRLSRTDWEKWD
jgi:ribosomal-protein-alanine N-acetyltransferase